MDVPPPLTSADNLLWHADNFSRSESVHLAQLSEDIRKLVTDNERLKRGEFTTEEMHNFCHNLHGKVDARAFADGCTDEQRKLYGCAPDADRVAILEAQDKLNRKRIDALEAALAGERVKSGLAAWLADPDENVMIAELQTKLAITIREFESATAIKDASLKSMSEAIDVAIDYFKMPRDEFNEKYSVKKEHEDLVDKLVVDTLNSAKGT